MEDLKLMTVRALRELARSRLGPGYSKLKTKAELIAALAKKVVEPKAKGEEKIPEAKQPEAKQPETAKPAASRAEPAVEPAKPSPKAAQTSTASSETASKPPPKFEPGVAGKAAKPGEKPVDLAALRIGATEPLEQAEEPAAEAAAAPVEPSAPLAEPPPRKMSQAEIDLVEENLGELPFGYGDDSVGLLARDPHTLWVYWDFAEQTARRAHEGLPNSRAVLRLFDGGHLVREVDIALESRAWYLHHVTPGRHYRAEIQFVGVHGEARRVGPSSNAMRVPNEGPSPVIDDRFIKLPWDVPFQRSAELIEHAHPGQPFPERERAALLARAEEGLHQEGLRDGQPGQVEVYYEVVRGLGGSDTMVELMRRRAHFGGQWTSSRPGAAWTSSRPG